MVTLVIVAFEFDSDQGRSESQIFGMVKFNLWYGSYAPDSDGVYNISVTKLK